jgi:hypothetical protein
MAKTPNLFSKIRTRITRTGRQAKFATVKFGADLSSFVPAPQSLLERLGIKTAFVPAGVRPSVRTTIVTPTMLRKARLEAEEGRTLSPAEAKRIRGGKRFIAEYLKQKLRLDPRLDDISLFHPSYWNRNESFQWNWMRDHRRFLRLAQERTGIRYELTETGEWIKMPRAGASRKVMSADDWSFYTRHYYANYDFYSGIGPDLLELPPGEISPRTIRRGPSPGRPNQTGRSVGSYRGKKSGIFLGRALKIQRG